MSNLMRRYLAQITNKCWRRGTLSGHMAAVVLTALLKGDVKIKDRHANRI